MESLLPSKNGNMEALVSGEGQKKKAIIGNLIT